MTNWLTYRLGDVITFKNGFAFKPSDYISASTDGYEVFRMGYIEPGRGFKEDDRKVFIHKSVLKGKKQYFVEVGDILIAMTDMKDNMKLLGYSAYIKESNRFVLNQRVGLIRSNTQSVNQRFLYYLLNEKRYIQKLRSGANTGVQANLSTAGIKDINITVPPLPEQHAIASILSALDDKIELNLQMNKTLEEMAMTLYKYWFVDFGPFRDGECVSSELREIPNGWEMKKIEDVIPVKDGTHDSPKQAEEGYFLITSKHIKKHEIDLTSAYRISEVDFQKVNQRSKVDHGDILMTMIGTVGVFYLVNEIPNFAIKNIGLFKTSKTPELKYYMSLFFNSEYSTQYIKSQLAGSTQQYLTLKVLRDFPFLHPPIDVLQKFNSIVSGLFESIENNMMENQTLTTLRSTLLPKLISGEVRVKEAAKSLAEVL